MSVSTSPKNIASQPDFIRALSTGWKLNSEITFSFEVDRYLDSPLKIGDNPADIDIQVILSRQSNLMPGQILNSTNSYIRSSVEDAFEIISTYANIDFRIESSANSYLHIFTIDQLSDPSLETHTHGYGTYPKSGENGAYAIFDTSLPTNVANPEIDSGGVRNMVALHEIMHNLGLYHPHDEDNGTELLDPALDNTKFTVMSYNFFNASKTTPSYGFPVTPSPLDVAALQFLYNERANNADNTTYKWIPSTGTLDLSPDTDNQISVGRALYTIWDTSGEDTLDFSDATDRTLINLNHAHLVNAVSDDIQDALSALATSDLWSNVPDYVKQEITGSASYFGGYLSGIFGSTNFAPGGFLIANKSNNSQFDSGVENAIGSAFSDILIGNVKNNKLKGGDGDDLIYGGEGNDSLWGEAGYDELRGGNGKDVIDGGAGDDIIWFGRDGDSVRGGTGSDIFKLDELFSSGWGGEVWGGIDVGGADNDTIHFSKDFMDAWGPGWALEYATLGSIAGIKIEHVETLVIGMPGESGNTSYNLETFAADFFANRLPGLEAPNTLGTVQKATIIDTNPNDTVVYTASIPFSSDLDITGYSASFGYNDQEYDLVMSLTHWADEIQVTLSLPSDFEYDLDANDIAGFVQQNNIQIDYERTVSEFTETGIIEYTIAETKYYTTFTGVQNSYDNGLTTISGPDVVYVDRWLYDQSTGSTEIAYSHDSIEPGKPVRYWLANDTSGLLQIDSETGVVTTRSNLFRDGQTVLATIVASDGISEVTKDIEVRLDTTLETAPEFIATYELPEVLPVTGWGAGTFDFGDNNYGEKWRFTVEVVGATANDPLFKMSPDGMPGFVIARTPTASEIGVTHQVKITVTDDTGQSDTSFMNVTIAPLEGVMEGTSGDDYLTPDSWSERVWTINGGEGNDDLDTGYLNNRIGKTTLNGGDGNDRLTLSAAYTTANGDAGEDQIFMYADNTTANGGDGNDAIGSWAYYTLIDGGEGDDIISAYYDRATINGGSGSDTITFYGSETVIDAGDGDDVIHSFGQALITGGAGADTIYTLNDTIIFNDISNSYLNNVSLTGSTGPEGLWDTIFGVNDDTIIDLSALGEIEWEGSSTSSSSMLATMLEGDNPGDAFFVVDANRDGGYDFGIELRNVQAMNAIHFNGLDDWLI